MDGTRVVELGFCVAGPGFVDLFARAANAAALVEVFAGRLLDEWAEVFDREGVWWAPVQPVHELVDDPQAAAAGRFVCGYDDRRVVATPIDCGATRSSPGAGVPEMGQHTEELLLELGYAGERIISLKGAGAIL